MVEKQPFGAMPFDWILATWTDSQVRDWSQVPFTFKDLRV